MSIRNPMAGGNFASQMISLVASLRIFDGFTKKTNSSFNLLKNELDKTIGMQRGFTKGGAEVYRKSTKDLWSYVGKYGAKGGGAVSSSVASTITSGAGGGPFSKITQMFSGAAGLALKPFGKLKEGFSSFSQGFGGTKTTGIFNKVGNSIGGFASKVTKIPQAKLGQMAGSLGQMAMAGLASGGMMVMVQLLMQLLAALNPFQPLLDALTTIFGVYGSILETAFTPLIEKLFEIMLDPNVIALVQLLADTIGILVGAFLPLLDILAPIGQILLTALIAPLQLLAPIITLFAVPLQLLITAITPLIILVANLATQFLIYLMPIITIIVQILTAIVSFNFAALGGFFGDLWSAITDGFKNLLINPIIGFLNAFTNTLNSWDTMNWFPDIGTIPYLAKGGIVSSPTLAMIGEAGPEAVVPLSGSNAGSMGVTINVYGEVTEEKLFKMQRDAWLNNLG